MSTTEAKRSHGALYGIGVGPGDPGLVTLKAADLIRRADVVAYHAGTGRQSMARSIVADLIKDGVIEEELRYPVTTGTTEHDLGYYDAMEDFYDECTDRLSTHLERGRIVVVLAVGDPLFFGSFMYVHDRLSPRFFTEVVPGVTSVSAATAAVATGLCRHEDTLTVLPGTLPVPELARRLADTDAAIIMKLGQTFTAVREAIAQAGLTDRAVYVERASGLRQRVLAIADVDPETVPYMSLVVIPGEDFRGDAAGRAQALRETRVVTGQVEPDRTGTLHVVGLGPGPRRWLSPEAEEVLARVSHVVGYGPYLARVPPRDGLARHPSGNTVEVERGRLALNLALSGEEVAVVSGGDAGVFGMAAAVFEAAERDQRYAAVPIHVVPGITAAHAASALAGAALGGDHCLISLSDRLKPWPVVLARLRAAALADMTVAIYNPRSRSRPDQLAAARTALLKVAEDSRVVLVAHDVGRAGESLTITTLRDLDPGTVDMGSLVIIGSSSTRVSPTGRVWTPRWVEGDAAGGGAGEV